MKKTNYDFIDSLSSFFVGAIIGGFLGLIILRYVLQDIESGVQIVYCIGGPALGVGLFCLLFGTKGSSKATESYFDWIRFWRWWR